jgi:hypothetical protein
MPRARPRARAGAGAAWAALLAALLAVGAPCGALAQPGAAAAPPAPVPLLVRNGGDFGAVLDQLSQRGPPLEIALRGNISWTDVPGPRPVVVARNVTIAGAGRPERTELNLNDATNAWRLEPGVVLTLRNLTLSNLAQRPPSAEPPPPLNASGERPGRAAGERGHAAGGRMRRAAGGGGARPCGSRAPPCGCGHASRPAWLAAHALPRPLTRAASRMRSVLLPPVVLRD